MLPGLNAVDGLKRFFLRRARFFMPVAIIDRSVLVCQ